eukprot:2833367-Rhodomonas_salina.1
MAPVWTLSRPGWGTVATLLFLNIALDWTLRACGYGSAAGAGRFVYAITPGPIRQFSPRSPLLLTFSCRQQRTARFQLRSPRLPIRNHTVWSLIGSHSWTTTWLRNAHLFADSVGRANRPIFTPSPMTRVGCVKSDGGAVCVDGASISHLRPQTWTRGS